MAGWKVGRGAIGPLLPLVGTWVAASPSSAGDGVQGTCHRTFTRLGTTSLVLEAIWALGGGRTYREIAVYGIDDDGHLAAWSFTSDGKRSVARRVDGTDVHPQAVAFVADMPAGRARMVYWPPDDDDGGFRFAVESGTQKGWRRFLDHRYRPVAGDA
jgi:hypothetical protein